MKTSFFKFLLAGASALASLGFATSAQAVLAAPTAPYAVYSFNANCVDCAQNIDGAAYFDVSGSLTLQSFVPGGAVTPANFYSLSYGGSNLFGAFTVYGADVVGDSGFFLSSDAFPANGDPAALNFYATFEAYVAAVPDIPGNLAAAASSRQIFFETFADGTFRLGDGTNRQPDSDHGNQADWTLSQVVRNDVPEPGSLLLVGAALVAVGVARRRRV